MYQQPDLGYSPCVEVALADAGLAAEDAVIVEVLEVGEGEPHQGAGEDEEEDKVVALGEADGVVDFAGRGHETVGWRSGWLHHFG